MNQTALVIASIDGITTRECGIGVIVDWFFEALENRQYQFNADLFVVGAKVNASSKDYRSELADRNARLCHEHGGQLLEFPVENSESLSSGWAVAFPDQWRSYCQSAAQVIQLFSDRYAKVIIVAHGLMLTGLRLYFENQNQVKIIFVAHSLGHAGHDAMSVHRVIWESEAFEVMKNYDDTVAPVSPFFQQLLSEKYHLPNAMLIPYHNGIYQQASCYQISAKQKETILEKYQIKPDVPLYFSWGRAVPTKGCDLIFKAFQQLLDESAIDPKSRLIILAPASCGNKQYVQQLQKLAVKIPHHQATLLLDFDEQLPHVVLGLPQTKAVVFASKYESFMLTAAEALAFGHVHLKHLYYNIPPVHAQYQYHSNAFSFLEWNSASMISVWKQMQHAPSLVKKTTTFQVSDFVENTKEFLKQVM